MKVYMPKFQTSWIANAIKKYLSDIVNEKEIEIEECNEMDNRKEPGKWLPLEIMVFVPYAELELAKQPKWSDPVKTIMDAEGAKWFGIGVHSSNRKRTWIEAEQLGQTIHQIK